MTTLPPLHPGEVLRAEFTAPLGPSAIAVSRTIHVPRTRIERIISEHTGISADTALRQSRLLGTTPEFWLNLQSRYDVETAKRQIHDDLATIDPLAREAA